MFFIETHTITRENCKNEKSVINFFSFRIKIMISPLFHLPLHVAAINAHKKKQHTQHARQQHRERDA
jgi:hypothetical protein